MRREFGSGVLAAFAFCLSAAGQSAGTPVFEVASVRRVDSRPADPGFVSSLRGGPGTTDPTRITYTNENLYSLLRMAFGDTTYRLIGPAWLTSEYYTITASVPAGATQQQFAAMLQNLLLERFAMKVHRETKELDVYEMSIAKAGLKLRPSAAEDIALAGQPPSGPLLLPEKDAKGYPQLARPGIANAGKMVSGVLSVHVVGKAQTVAALAKYISSWAGFPILDKTGLDGLYDFALDFAPEGMRPPGSDLPDVVPHAPEALQSQLGLKLDAKKRPLHILVVDSANPIPLDN